MTQTTQLASTVQSLRRELTGKVIAPDDPSYDRARVVFYGGLDPHPPVIVQVADSADVARVVNFARDNGIEFAVRSGGHSVAGHSTTDHGIVLDLRAMKRLDIDVESRTAWAEAGLTAVEYTQATAKHGLVTGFGDTGSVGIGGITLGGGVGYLVRKHGLTIDSLLAAEIVTADGQTVMADSETNPDLFWAIRGGGGNFGVATKFQYRLQPIDTIVGGMMILPATASAIVRFIAESEAAPDELSTIANVMNCPPMPFVPEDLHGSLVIMGLVAWCGEVEAGKEMMKRLAGDTEPIADMTGPIAYPELYPPEEDYHPTAVAKTMFADSFDEATAQIILDRLAASDASLRVAQIRVLGGAMARIPNDDTAFAHRDRKLMINVAAFYEGAEDLPRREQWVAELAGILSNGDDRGYAGFLADEGQGRVRAAYPGDTWERLRRVKAKYDPGNLFRLNQNIPPAD
ncbi:MAG TPA: FAD-binding oxidoreductase [Acidimicrobiia bacterium]|nr:FAD-binding oxidoreductase [Acidimicrobiia bacterium]